MIVCIAEKPSVGRDIARVLGANTKHEGYMEGNGYQVTWTFGHLCSLLDPSDYNEEWKHWSLGSLPMIPPRFGIKLDSDSGVHKQFKIIQSLFKQADEIINCGDAGQEGELIQRWVQQKAGVKCPVKRLWISSLTEDAIREGFQKLKDQDAYQKLYEAGLMRSIGDWLLGMNATRAYSMRYGTLGQPAKLDKNNRAKFQPLSVGRVQTPTLALIVQRQQEIDHFVPRTYWELKTDYRGTIFNAIIRKDEETEDTSSETGKTAATTKEEEEKIVGIEPIQSAEEGAALVNRLQQFPFKVTKVEKKKGTEYAPRLFDLTSLQVECSKKFSYSADKTLNLIQSLYEKHITTYPRVDTTFLSEDIYPKVPGILKGIEAFFPQVGRLRELMREEQTKTGKPQKLPKSKKVFDNKKVTDHHAIIPTGQAPRALTPEEQKVFDLIALRFIAAFYPECRISTTTIWGEVAADNDLLVPFRTSGRQILFAGWREVFDKKDEAEEGEAEEKVLPDFKEGEQGEHTPSLIEKQTTPPKPYTEGTLLRAMETAGKLVEDEELRDALKENGIGRPSTRAEIIKKLFQRDYIVQKGKSLFPTPLAIALIHTINTPILKSAELTGQWEKKLRMIERGEMDAQTFLNELKELTAEVVFYVKSDQTGMRCPVCRQGTIIRGRAAFGCSRWKEGCTYRMPFPQYVAAESVKQ